MGSIPFPALTPDTSEDAVISAPTFCKESVPRQGLEPLLQRGRQQTSVPLLCLRFLITGEQEAHCNPGAHPKAGLLASGSSWGGRGGGGGRREFHLTPAGDIPNLLRVLLIWEAGAGRANQMGAQIQGR